MSDAEAQRPITIQYLGFQDVGDRREYRFDARRGEHARRYSVSIELVAFSTRQVLLQDGPDICYQKLARDAAASQLHGPGGLDVTESDLAAYRAAHAAPGRKGFSPSRQAGLKPAGDEASPAKGGESA